MGGLFGGKPTKISSSAPIIAGFRVQTSAYGRVLGRVFGKTRVTANMMWYGDFTAIPHTTVTDAGGGKGGGGGSTQQSTTYTYSAALLMLLCKGVITAVDRVWKDKEQTTLAALGLSLYYGNDAQTAFPHLSTNHPAEALGYRGLAYVASAALDLGDSAQLGNHTFEVEGELPFSGSIKDSNPKDVVIAMIQEAGIDVARIGDLTPFSNYCVANGIFVSPAYMEQRRGFDVIKALAMIGNAEVVCSEDLIKLVPHSDEAKTGNGATFTPNVTPVFEFDDDDFLGDEGEDPVRFEELDASDAYNIVKVKFFNRDKDYAEDVVEAQDDDNIALYGRRPMEEPVTLYEIVDPAVARLVVQNILQRNLYNRGGLRFDLGPGKADLLEPMDVIALNHSPLSLESHRVRILEIEELDDDRRDGFSFLVRDFASGAAQGVLYPTESGLGYKVNFNAAPGDSNDPVIIDAPGALTVGGFELWMAVSGGPDWGGCQVWVATDPGGPFKQVGTVFGSARHGELSAPLPAGSDPDTVNTASVDLAISRGSLISGSQDDADKGNTLCYVGGELISYQDATLTAPNEYDLETYLRRGVLGTPVSAHTSGATFVRLDQALFRYPYDPELVGQTLYIKVPAFNVFGAAQQGLEEVDAYSYVIQGSIGRPATPTGYTASQNGAVAVFQWQIVPAANIKGYEIRYLPQLNRAATDADYQNATPLTRVTRGTQITTAKLPPGTWTTFLKSIDNSDKEAIIAATFDVTMTSTFDLIVEGQQAPDWLGTKTNFLVHWTGVLVPESTKEADELTREELFEQFVPYAEAVCIYETPELDLTVDGPTRIWSDIQSALGRGATGIADPQLSIDYRLEAGAYDGFEDWTIGNVNCRRVKGKLTLTTDDGICYVSGFNLVADAEERVEEAEVAIAGGGSTITFINPFRKIPSVELFNAGSSARIPVVQSITESDFIAHLYDTSNSNVGGTGRYVATGV